MSLFPIQYQCDSCGKKPKNPTSMLCTCGGEYHSDINIGVPATTFEPHYCETIKQHVSSWSDQEKKAKAFRSVDHPEGFTLLQANTKYMKQLKKTYANREDIKAEQFAKDGFKYPKGKNAYLDPQKNTFVDKHTKQPLDSKQYSIPTKPLRISDKVKLKTAAIIVGFMLIASSSFAKIDGVPYVTLTVNGQNYEVPIHTPDFTIPDAKLIMDMLDGDKNSRKIFLEGRKEKLLFIGDGEKIRWLHVTEDKEWVQE